MKKLVSVLVALIMVFAMGTIAFAETTVTDEAGLIAALASGGEIKLANDITTTSAIITSGVTATIDLGGNTLNIGAGDNKFIDASNITIKNGDIDITGLVVSGGNAVFCLDEYEKTLVTTLTLENVNLTGNGYSSAYGIFYIGDSSVLNVTGGEWNLADDSFSAGGVFKADSSKATLNVTGTKFELHNVRRVVTYAKTVLEDVTMTVTGDANGVDAEMEHGFNRSPLTIKNSTIVMKDMAGRGITAENGDVFIENSSVTMSNVQEATIDVRNNKTVTIDSESDVSMDEDPVVLSGSTISGTVTVDESVGKAAKIGDKYYKTIEEAVDKVKNGETIVLLENVSGSFDIEDGEEVVIDLNEKTLKLDPAHGSAGTETNGSRVLYGGKLTIKNGTIECGTESSVPGKTLKVGIANYGELTLEDVTFNASETVRYTINNRGILNLKGKTTVNENKNPVDSAYDANHKVWAITNDPYDYVPAEDAPVNAELNVEKEDKEVSVGPVQVEQYTRNNNSNAEIELNIKAGTFAGIYSDKGPQIKIPRKIEGGTFGNDVSDYIVEGYLVDENGSVREFVKASISSDLDGKEFKLFKLGYFTVSVEMNDDEEVVGYLELDDTENLIRLEQKVNGVWEEIEEFTFEGVTEDTKFELRAIYSKEGEYTFTAGVCALVPGSTAPDYDTIDGSFEVEFKVTTLPNNRPSSKPVEKPETETEKNPNTGAPVFAPAIILVSAAAAFFKKR